MRIKEFIIRRYGPLREKNYNLGGNFILFFGKNEYGKTLTIDALIKLLLGKNIKDFKHIDRVEEKVDGDVFIEDDKGREIRIPEKGNLTKISNLTPSECRNIFIIRNSDLSIAHENEFYTNVTDRLTGLRTEEISKIKNELFEIGKITPGDFSFKNTKGEKKLKTRIENAKKILSEIESLTEKIKKEKFNNFEKEINKLKEKIEETGKEMRNLEDARKREKYEKGERDLNELKNNLVRLKNLEIYNEDDMQLWRDGERDIQRYSKEKKDFLSEIQRKEEELEEIEEKLSDAERRFKILEERKRKIDDEIKPELNIYRVKSEELVKKEVKSKSFNSLGIISVILLGISSLGIILTHSLLFYILTILFLISFVIFGTFRFQFVRDKANLGGAFERIKLTLAKFEITGDTIEEIFSNIQKFDEEYRKTYEELQGIKRKRENLEEKIKELQNEEIPGIEKNINRRGEEIDKIKGKSGEILLEDYSKKLKLKKELEKVIGERKSALASLLGEKSKRFEENISFWAKEIENLEEYKDKAKSIKYNEAHVSDLKKEMQEYKQSLKNLKDHMNSIQKEMENVEREINEILFPEEHLYCKTSWDLEIIKNKLQEFIKEKEENKDLALESVRIFNEIEKEEKEKVSDLFGKNSHVSKYFREITDGLYEEVILNQETEEIEVRRKDGIMLGMWKLSGGAYDQLYFSIRLALGEKLLKGKKGFFIMDDPFIKSDTERLQKQIETLKKISKSGWQTLYFSAKNEIKELLQEDIRKGVVNYVKIQGIF